MSVIVPDQTPCAKFQVCRSIFEKSSGRPNFNTSIKTSLPHKSHYFSAPEICHSHMSPTQKNRHFHINLSFPHKFVSFTKFVPTRRHFHTKKTKKPNTVSFGYLVWIWRLEGTNLCRIAQVTNLCCIDWFVWNQGTYVGLKDMFRTKGFV